MRESIDDFKYEGIVIQGGTKFEGLGKPPEKNWMFYDNLLISIATYPSYLIMA